jgi:hypothetical protein
VARRAGGLDRPHLADGQGGGRPRRQIAPGQVQRQDPTARRFGDGRQPLVLPALHDATLRRAAGDKPAPGALRAGLGRRPRPDGAVQRPEQSPLHHHRRQRLRAQPVPCRQIERAVGQRIAGRGPAAAKDRDQAVPHQAGGLRAGQHGIEQLAQRIAAQPEHALVEFGAKARQRGSRSGVHAADYPHPGALSLLGPSFVQTQVRMTLLGTGALASRHCRYGARCL